MGNALRKEDIAWQLRQMHEQGIGGVEQITMEPVYEKGNHDYLSPTYFELLRYAVEQAQALGMEFSINFGGPGWIWGGAWLPKEDQSKVLLASMMRLEGPQTFSGALPEQAAPNPNDLPRSTPIIAAEDRLIKVVAARLEDGCLRSESLRELEAPAQGRKITWDVPEGQWQLMAFWLTQRDNADAVDHLNQGAMERYCEQLGGQYAAALAGHLGKTVESFFSDSFEVPIYRNGLYWTDGLFASFKDRKGYDLAPWLPALWWDVDGLSPKVRYDVNQFLHEQGMTAFFRTFLGWCERHDVRGRIQPYGFVTDNIEGAGAADIPEMEITAGEKDAVPWFDTRIGPKQYVASGAHLYGRPIVTAEAFTYLHWEPYRETLEELKIATDGYLCAGANKLYNHGYLASPERGIVPTRGFFAAIRISHENLWWPYYHLLSEYTARACWLLQQGDPVVTVAVYSPLATQWTQSVLNARKWTREFEWGGLGQLLLANGFNFDLVNDDLLQHRTAMDGAQLRVGKMCYGVLLLPDVQALPLETFQQVEAFVRQGGVVIALERTPDAATGMLEHEKRDADVKRLSAELFAAPAGPNDAAMRHYGKGRTYCLENVMRRDDPLDWRSAPLDPFLKTLRECVLPDVDIDLVRAGRRNNDGLAYTHRRTDSMDCYFVANLQDAPMDEVVGFHVTQGRPCEWDPHTGERRLLCTYSHKEDYTRLPLSMAPFESRFIVFERAGDAQTPAHVTQSDFVDVLDAQPDGFTARATRNGRHAFEYFSGAASHAGAETVEGLPAVFEIGGVWRFRAEGEGAPKEEFRWPELKSWTSEERLRHFSGHGHYSIPFELPQEYCSAKTHLRLSLGVVGNVAEIRVNGQAVGVHWRNGQDFALDGLVHPGSNLLEVDVINTLINRVSGLNAFPEVPEDLQPVFGRGLARATPEADKLMNYQPLPRSGLLGPVRISPLRELRVRIGT